MPKALNKFHQRLGATLLRYRRQKGLTQSYVAQKIGCPRTGVAKIEAGLQRVDVERFMLICEVLNINPTTILDALLSPEIPPANWDRNKEERLKS